MGAALRGDSQSARSVGRAPVGGGARAVSGEGHGVSRRHGCQTGGRVLADRGLFRLLGGDWPRTLDELEELRRH